MANARTAVKIGLLILFIRFNSTKEISFCTSRIRVTQKSQAMRAKPLQPESSISFFGSGMDVNILGSNGPVNVTFASND